MNAISVAPSIYPQRESKTVEFKAALPDFGKLARTCVAFANGAGGEIIIGVEDKSRRIIGVPDKDRDRLYDLFASSLYDSVSPVINPHIYEKSVGNKNLAVIHIWPGERKPYFLKSAGLPGGVYIRLGTCTRPANAQTVEDLVRENRHTGFDGEASGNPDSALSKARLKEFYGNSGSHNRFLADKVIVEKSGGHHLFEATHGGILMFTDQPDQYIPETLITATHFSGVSGREIVQSVDLHGPIPELLAGT